MKTRSAKAKGQNFQKEVAEMIAGTFHLTIEALSPVSVGHETNGVRYVSEGDAPDLRVRTMGLAGADIVPLSERAQACFPFYVECKIRRQLPSLFAILTPTISHNEFSRWMKVLVEESERKKLPYASLLVFRSNRSIPWCLFFTGGVDLSEMLSASPFHAFGMGRCVGKRQFVFMPFASFLVKLSLGILSLDFIEHHCKCGCGVLTAWNDYKGRWHIHRVGHHHRRNDEKPLCALKECGKRVAGYWNRFCSNSCKQKGLYVAGRHNMQRPEIVAKQAKTLSEVVAAKIGRGEVLSHWKNMFRGMYVSCKSGKREWYESGWERKLFLVLDRWRDVTFWTKAHGIVIPYVFDGKDHLYTPDVLAYVGKERWLFEVKPEEKLSNEIVQVKAAAAVEWCAHQGPLWKFLFATEKNGWLEE